LKQNIIPNIRRICGLLLFKKSYKSLPQKIDAIIFIKNNNNIPITSLFLLYNAENEII
jgi:hypothetical protein